MQATRVEELKDQLARLGLEIDQYGDEQVIVRGVPAILHKANFEELPCLQQWLELRKRLNQYNCF